MILLHGLLGPFGAEGGALQPFAAYTLLAVVSPKARPKAPVVDFLVNVLLSLFLFR